MYNVEPDPFADTDRFTVIRRIGQGGMGVVYEAYDHTRQMAVAVKTITGRDATDLYRFKREFRSLANITHRNLATLYELFADTTPWFFTMELVNGITFLDYVRSSSPLDYTRLSAALAELATGISDLHARKKLHRDIKPSNVLVEPTGRVVILDFGLVMDLEHTPLGAFPEDDWFGTAAYVAPEQVARDVLTEAADWYGVGCLLFHSLTGRLPFEGDAQAIIDAKLARNGPPPRRFSQGIPEVLDRICAGLLKRDAEERFTGNDILDHLGSRLLSIDTSPAPLLDHPMALVGRDLQLASLESALASVRGDRPVTMYVHGPSGSGKTALVEHFLNQLSLRSDVLVLSGRCYERESVRYKALDTVVDFLSRYLAGLSTLQIRRLIPTDRWLLVEMFPVLASILADDSPDYESVADPQERRRRAVAAFRTLLTGLARRVHLLICIDDLQWGDLDSALLINELLRQPGGPGLLMLATYRSEDAATSACLRSLLDAPASAAGISRRELALEPLSIADAERLAYELLDEESVKARILAASIARESGGSPLFVRELVAYIQSGQPLAALPSSRDPISFDDLLRRRLSRVPSDATRLLEIVAVSGQPLREIDAFDAAELFVRDPAILTLLRSAQLVRTRGSGESTAVEIYHDRIREALVGGLPADTRQHHHRRLALTLQAAGHEDPDTLATHFQGAGDPMTAGHYYLLAADAAARALAFDRAAELYRGARDLRQAAGAELNAIRVKLGHALANAGRGWEAAREYKAAREGASEPAAALELQRLAGYQYCISGHVQEGRLALREALRMVGVTMSATPRRALWPLLRDRTLLRLRGTRFDDRARTRRSKSELARIDAVWSAATGLAQIDLITAASFQAHNLLLSLRAGEPYRVARALALEAMSSALEGTAREQRAALMLTAARQIAGRIQEPHALGMVALADGVTAMSGGRWTDGTHALDEAEAIFRTRCVGVIWELATLHHFRVWSLAFRGAYREMMSHGHAVLNDARERNDVYTPSTIGMFVEPIQRLLDDDPHGSRKALHDVAREWTHRGVSLQRVMQYMQETFIDLYAGDGEGAWHRLNEWWPELRASYLLRLEQMRIQMLHLRAACAIQASIATRDPSLLRVAEKDAGRMERERAPWALPEAQIIRASLAAQRGDRAGAAELLDRSASRCETLGRGQFARPARWQQGRLVGGDEGRRLTAAAESAMVEQGIRNPARWTALHLPGFAP
jgi:eukaryotic-like serine/threonine-protein kinase